MTKQELKQLYNDICFEFDDEQIKALLHLKSVGNFIRHFDSLKQQNKEKVRQKISNYLILLKENKTVFLYEKIDSLYLFSEYIQPIGLIYQKDVDFGIVAVLWMQIVDIIIFCVLGYVAYYFLNTSVFVIVVLLFLFWYGRKQFIRRRSGKFYQYQY